MRIYFHGATGDVTGSAYHVVTKHASVLVDCGLFQGRKAEREKNRREDKLEGGRLDAVVLTHGHLDHVGRLPLLTRNGYKGPIYATRATLDIATLILRDSLRLQLSDVERENRKRERVGLEPLEPLFEEKDVRRLKPLTRAVAYNQTVEGTASAGERGQSVGIRVDLPFEQEVNSFVELAFEHRTFFTRLHHFVLASDAFVVAPGGIGTVLETLMIRQLLQVRHLQHTPLILVGKMWPGLIEWARSAMLSFETPLADAADMDIPRCVEDGDEAVAIIRERHAQWTQERTRVAAVSDQISQRRGK